jgi:hypothetical protein
MAKKGGPGPSSAWKPGETGNPGGRPAVVKEVRELAQQYTVEAIETLANIMQDPSEHASARVHAADIILNRGHGKAPQVIENRNFDSMPEADLDKFIRDSLRRLADLGSAAGDAEGAGGGGKKVRTH